MKEIVFWMPFAGSGTTRAFGRERHEQDRFEAASREVSKIFQKMESVSGLVHPLSEVPTATLLLGILVIMAMRTPGQMAASMTFLILLYRLQPRIKQFDADYNQGLDWDSSRRALDVISEKFVQDAVGRFGRGRTVLMIAHRIGTIEHADKVIVFDAGRVVESGSVPQLLAMGGLFSQFFALQLRKRHAVEELQAHLLSA